MQEYLLVIKIREFVYVKYLIYIANIFFLIIIIIMCFREEKNIKGMYTFFERFLIVSNICL